MLSMLLTLPALVDEAPKAPLPVVEAKDLPEAPRGPLTPQLRDPGREPGITGRIRAAARQGPSLAALQLPEGSVRIKDQVPDISGWKAYAIRVPAGGTVKVEVVEGRRGWFRVFGVNEWGRDEPGLLQNRIPSGDPKATYKNLGAEARTIYFVVDTLEENMVGELYELEVIRG